MNEQVLRCCLTTETNTTQLLYGTEGELCQWWSWGFQFPEVSVTRSWQAFTAIVTVHSSATALGKYFWKPAGSLNICANRDHKPFECRRWVDGTSYRFLYTTQSSHRCCYKRKCGHIKRCLLYHDSHPPAVFILHPSLDFPQDLLPISKRLLHHRLLPGGALPRGKGRARTSPPGLSGLALSNRGRYGAV